MKCTRKIKIANFPKVLVVTLQRAAWQGGHRRLSSKLAFPKKLSLSEYAAPKTTETAAPQTDASNSSSSSSSSAPPATLTSSLTSSTSLSSPDYELVGVVVHVPSMEALNMDLNAGHYYSLVKVREKKRNFLFT